MPKIRVVRATPRELQQSMRARDWIPSAKKKPEKKETEILLRYPLRAQGTSEDNKGA